MCACRERERESRVCPLSRCPPPPPPPQAIDRFVDPLGNDNEIIRLECFTKRALLRRQSDDTDARQWREKFCRGLHDRECESDANVCVCIIQIYKARRPTMCWHVSFLAAQNMLACILYSLVRYIRKTIFTQLYHIFGRTHRSAQNQKHIRTNSTHLCIITIKPHHTLHLANPQRNPHKKP